VSPADRILASLRVATGTVSGEELAATLGVSRAAVFKHVETLRARGYEIAADHAQGYRLVATPDRLDATELGPRLRGSWRRVEWRAEVDSTQQQARELAKRDHIDIRYYSIIYNVVDDARAALTGMLAPTLRERFLGNAEIREVFNITKFGKVAGCMVVEGTVKRGAKVRLLRDSVVIHEGALKTLKDAPFGPFLLTLVAAGIAAYGVYSFARARYARV